MDYEAIHHSALTEWLYAVSILWIGSVPLILSWQLGFMEIAAKLGMVLFRRDVAPLFDPPDPAGHVGLEQSYMPGATTFARRTDTPQSPPTNIPSSTLTRPKPPFPPDMLLPTTPRMDPSKIGAYIDATAAISNLPIVETANVIKTFLLMTAEHFDDDPRATLLRDIASHV